MNLEYLEILVIFYVRKLKVRLVRSRKMTWSHILLQSVYTSIDSWTETDSGSRIGLVNPSSISHEISTMSEYNIHQSKNRALPEYSLLHLLHKYVELMSHKPSVQQHITSLITILVWSQHVHWYSPGLPQVTVSLRKQGSILMVDQRKKQAPTSSEPSPSTNSIEHHRLDRQGESEVYQGCLKKTSSRAIELSICWSQYKIIKASHQGWINCFIREEILEKNWSDSDEMYLSMSKWWSGYVLCLRYMYNRRVPNPEDNGRYLSPNKKSANRIDA